MNNFPYPVLCDSDSSYIEASKFNIECALVETRDNLLVCRFNYLISSNFLNSLIEMNDLRIIVKIKSGLVSLSTPVQNSQDYFVIRIDTSALKNNDVLEVSAYLIATHKFKYIWNDELNPELYDKFLDVPIRKNDILAISNCIKIPYTQTNPEFLRIVESNAQGNRGYKINLNKNNYVEILVGKKMSHSYYVVKNNKTLISIFNSHLVFEVIVYILVNIINNYDEYENKEWFRSLSILMEKSGMPVDVFITYASYDGKIEIDKVYDFAQVLINNQIEKSLIASEEPVNNGIIT